MDTGLANGAFLLKAVLPRAIAAVRRWYHLPGAVIVNFHNVGIDNAFTRNLESISIDVNEFESRLKFLKERFEIVPFSHLAKDRFNPRIAAITFDDGYKTIQTNALELLERLQCPAKIFLNSSQVSGELSWLNKLSFIIENIDRNEFASFCNEALPGQNFDSPPTVRDFRRNFCYPETVEAIQKKFSQISTNQSENLYLNFDDIQKMIGHPLLEWGSHTADHFPLHRLPLDVVQKQIIDGHQTLKHIMGDKLNGFALPFGGANLRKSEIADIVRHIGDDFVTATHERIQYRRIGPLLEMQRLAGESLEKLKVGLGEH